ncbi:MAG: hypothetical protein AAB543_07600, partial [Pseudomonadota bacterium]
DRSRAQGRISEAADHPVSGGGRMVNMNYLQMVTDFGVADTIAKPFLPDEILAKIAAALK